MSKLHRDNAGYVGCSFEETQDPYYSYNKLALPLGPTDKTLLRDEVTLTVTVVSTGSGNKYFVDGVQQAALSLTEGTVYKLDQSDSSNNNHPLKFSQISDGIWNAGAEYTAGVSYYGTPGSSGAYTQLVVPFGGVDLHYYCGHHPGMGSSAATPANTTMFTAGFPILKTTDQFGATGLVGGSAVNVVGDPTASTDNPFGSGNGHSVVFDGNDALRIQGGAIGTGNWTIEYWIYGADFSGIQRHVSARESLHGNEHTNLRSYNGSWEFYAGDDPGYQNYSGTTIAVNTWVHAAVCRNGTTIEYFADGSRIASDTIGSSVTTTLTEVDVAHGYGGEYFTGKISNVRVSDIARYSGSSYTIPTAGFTADANTLLLAAHTSSVTTAQGTWSSGVWSGTEDTAPDPYAANLVLAVPMNGSNGGTTFADRSAEIRGSGSAKTVHAVSATTSTAASLYYGSSAYFSTSTSSLSIDDATDFDFGTGDFTIETWLYQTEQNTNQYYVINAKYGTNVPMTWWWATIGGTMTFYIYDSAGFGYTTANVAVPLNRWTHVAVTRHEGRIRLYQDLVEVASFTFTGALNNTSHQVTIGEDDNGDYNYKGYMSDTRIYKGVAKYRPEEASSGGFQALEYEGNGGSNPITGLAFKPSLVWLKNNDTDTGHHVLYNSLSGPLKHMQTSTTNTEYTENANRGLTSFDSGGFTINTSSGEHVGSGNVNISGQKYIAYAWKAGANTTTNAVGSLNSTIYNQQHSITANITGNLPASSSNALANWFNGQRANKLEPSGSGSLDFSSVSALQNFSGTLQFAVSAYSGSTSMKFVINASTDNLTFTTQALPSSSGGFPSQLLTIPVTSLSTLDFTSVSGQSTQFWGMYLDGKLLVDSTATPDNIPSIASTVSTSTEYGFSIGNYSGTGSAATVAHNLGAKPDLLICKGKNGSGLSWATQFLGSGTSYFQVNSQDGNSTGDASAAWGADSTADVFSINTKPTTNEIPGNGNQFQFFAWKSVPGFSKVGTYSGTGSSGNVVTLGFRPSFLLIKADIAGEDWVIMDDAKSRANPVQEAFFANDFGVYSHSSAYNVDFTDTGFTVNNNNPRFNTGSSTYYYFAVAGRAPNDATADEFKLLNTLELKDLSSSNHATTNNGASFQTAVKKFYGGAAEFDGSSSYLSIPASSEFNFGTGDFTIEMWAYLKAAGSTPTLISSGNYYTVGSNGNWLLRRTNGTQIAFASYDGQGNAEYNELSAVTNLNTWNHIALTRRSNSVQVFVNGSPGGTMTVTKSLSDGGTNGLKIGHGNSNAYWNGYIQDVRVYKDIAKYTSSFSPPERSVQGTARRYPSGVYVVS